MAPHRAALPNASISQNSMRLTQNKHSAVGTPGIQKFFTVESGKTEFSGANRRLAVLKIVLQIV
jgi:hypothetical protein